MKRIQYRISKYNNGLIENFEVMRKTTFFIETLFQWSFIFRVSVAITETFFSVSRMRIQFYLTRERHDSFHLANRMNLI
jgi:hypothetical protein